MVQLLPWRWRSLLLSYDCRCSDEDWVGNSAMDFYTWLLSVLQWLITVTQSQARVSVSTPPACWNPMGPLNRSMNSSFYDTVKHYFKYFMTISHSSPVCVAVSTSAYVRWATEPWRTVNNQKPDVNFRVSEVCKSNTPKHLSFVNKHYVYIMDVNFPGTCLAGTIVGF